MIGNLKFTPTNLEFSDIVKSKTLKLFENGTTKIKNHYIQIFKIRCGGGVNLRPTMVRD